jgi:hypothetical protein
MTLTVVSINQYVTFAAARNYESAHIDLASQEKQARAKYMELISDKTLKPLYANGWFKVDDGPAIGVGDHTKIIQGYEEASEGINQFWGVGTNFVAKILDFHIPFFGDSAPDGDRSGSGFKTYIGSYLGREPTTAECLDFMSKRWEAIRNMPGGNYSQGTSQQGYYSMTDDGC